MSFNASTHRHERSSAGMDLFEMGAGLFAAAGNQMVISRDLQKLKPRIAQMLKVSFGVLLILRSEELRHILSVQTLARGIYLIGAGNQPEPLIATWRQRGSLFPAMQGRLVETFLWVVPGANLDRVSHRPPGYYATLADADIKLVPFEQI